MKANVKILPGFRTIKTAIAVFASLILYALISREGVIFAVMAILICMQDSVEKSIAEGINRTIGTIIGAVFGTIFVFMDIYYLNATVYYAIVMLGIIALIHVCHLIGIRRSIVIATVVYMVIILGAGDNPIQYSIDRTFDTLIGIVMAVIVNNFLFKPKIAPPKPMKIVMNNGNQQEEINFARYILEETSDRITCFVNLIDINEQNIMLGENAATAEAHRDTNQITIFDIEGYFKDDITNEL